MWGRSIDIPQWFHYDPFIWANWKYRPHMTKTRAHRRLAAILAADVAGYSRLMGADEAGTLARLRDMWARRFNPAVLTHRGRIVKMMGDGALVEFASAVDAVECAIAIQDTMRSHNKLGPRQQAIELRIGVNLGDIVIEGDDIFGDGVNIAARLEGQAPRSGILISDSVHMQIKGKVNFVFVDAGALMLKNIAGPLRAWRWGGDGQELPVPADITDGSDGQPSIAVLPFTNMSGDPEQEYFSDGITEDIITDLSRIAGLMVVARNSSFAYKGKTPDIRTVGRELCVTSVLEGSIRRAGNRVRITAQLINAKTGRHLWAERYDRDLTDIFAVQDEVTLQIVGALRVTLRPKEKALLEDSHATDIEAHDSFLRGRELTFELFRSVSNGREVFEKVVAAHSRSIELDPSFSGPYGGLAYVYILEYQNHWVNIPDALDLAAHFSALALTKNPNDAFAHFTSAVSKIWSRDLEGAKAAVEKALDLNPNFALAYSARGHIETCMGNPSAAIPDLERARRLDPAFAHQYLHFMGFAYLLAGQYATAAATFRERINLTPKTDLSRAFLASALGHLGHIDEARRVWGELMEINPKYSFAEHLARQPFQNPAIGDAITEGLTKAGLLP